MTIKHILAACCMAAPALTALADGSTYAGSMLYGYCTTAQSANSFNAGTTAGEAIQFNESSIKYFRGCKITAIAVANGAAAGGTATQSAPITVFTADELDGKYTSTIAGNMDFSKPFEYQEFTLAEPIEITADTKPFYVGYTVVCNPAQYYPVVTDGRNNEQAGPGDFYGMLTADGSWVWEQLRSQVGMACVRLKIEGDALPANDVSILESAIPTYAAPGGKASVGMYVQNDAGNVVNSVTVSYSINGGAPQTTEVKLPRPLLYNDYTTRPVEFTVDMPATEGADLPFTIEITGVNAEGAANNAPQAARTATGLYLSLDRDKGFDKNMVAEIATGTWCGYCPQGFVAVSKMNETYPDSDRFIPIAVHIGDMMAVQSYSLLPTEYTGEGSAPSVVVNRNVDAYGVQVPSFAFFNDVYNDILATPSLVKPEIKDFTFDAAKKRLTVNASAEFAIPVTGEYAFAYVLTEDNVGPYDQTNYYSPALGQGLTLEWWDEQPEQVNTLFGAVARHIYSFRGIKGSIPASVQPGGKYEHTGTLQTNLVDNIDNCHVILMVVNRTTGRIENAVSVPYNKEDSAIDSVEAEVTDAPAVYFDLQGRKVANPESGRIYIESRGGVSKTDRL